MDKLKETTNTDGTTNTDNVSSSATDSPNNILNCEKNIILKNSDSDILKAEFNENIKYGDMFSAGHKIFSGITDKGIGVKLGHTVDAKAGNDNLSISGKINNEINIDNLLLNNDKWENEAKNTIGGTIKYGIFEYTSDNNTTVGYSSERITTGYGIDNSIKIGNNNTYIKFNGGQSSKFGTDYSSSKTHYGAETKLGPFEGEAKHTTTDTNETETNANRENVDTETHSEETEVSGGVELGHGIKLKGSVVVDESDSFSQSESGTVKDQSTNFSTKTRLEVDSEKADPAVAVLAGMFNATQAVQEAALKEFFTTTNTVEYKSEEESANNDYYNDYGYGY